MVVMAFATSLNEPTEPFWIWNILRAFIYIERLASFVLEFALNQLGSVLKS